MPCRQVGPPWHGIEPAQHRVDLAAFATKTPTLDGREHVALQQNPFNPARRQHSGVVLGQPQTHAAAAMERLSAIQRSRSDSARALIARFLAMVLSLPRSLVPSAFRAGASASDGNKPKLIFIGWKERLPCSIVSIWPPVMWFRSAPNAVVAGGGESCLVRASAAA